MFNLLRGVCVAVAAIPLAASPAVAQDELSTAAAYSGSMGTVTVDDRQLYRLIYRDILPSLEKKIDQPRNYLHWDCLDAANNTEDWLRYYASEEEREQWYRESDRELPPVQARPFPRRMPRHSF